ncbi:MAG: hypothetical protein HZA34_00035 [Candidatus Pacebacteria bacterium]|nr:hypothetical protein [Candidatus Paceibacterota bacterium]
MNSFEQPTVGTGHKKSTREFDGNVFEVLEPSILVPKDIEKGDRVTIETSSGNKYILRQSESRPGFLKIYNTQDREQGSLGLGHFLYNHGEDIAKVGERFTFKFYTDPEKGEGREQRATTVVSIRITKGLDSAISDASPQTMMEWLADALKNAAQGE